MNLCLSRAKKTANLANRILKDGKAIQFPDTPDVPATMNAELDSRLFLLKLLITSTNDLALRMNAAFPKSSWQKASAWVYTWLLKGARESIDALGPLSDHAQKAMLNDFAVSLEKPQQNPKNETSIHIKTNPGDEYP